MLQKLKYVFAPGIFILFTSCFSLEQPAIETKKASPISQNPNNSEIKLPPLEGNDKIAKVISDHAEKSNCRIPQPSDFAFSEKALAAIKHTVGNIWIQTIALDNFDNNPLLNDFAVMLINKEDTAPNNFRLVFFLEQRTGYKTFELLNHANLSTSTMDKNRYGWYLTTYNVEGKIERRCGFEWNAKTEKIECVEVQ